VLAHDEAIIELARAVALSDMGRHDDALALIAQTAHVLHEFGDRRRLHQAALLKAIVHHRRGELAAARSTYEELLSLLEGTDDLHTLAAVYNNLGQVCIDLGQLSVALLALQHARSLLEALNMPAEQTRTDWVLARVLLSIGQYTNAISALQRIRAQFLSRGMSEEAALVGLDLIDASIATEQRDRAIALTEQVIAEFTAAGLNERAMTALSYLHDLVPTAAEPRRIVAHVRLYLENLRREPTCLFSPLDEPSS
jgi:tetratricopeptide (TPR) repeat protein